MIYACNLIECRHDKFLSLGRGPMPNAMADVKCQITFTSIFITELKAIEWKRIELNSIEWSGYAVAINLISLTKAGDSR